MHNIARYWKMARSKSAHICRTCSGWAYGSGTCGDPPEIALHQFYTSFTQILYQPGVVNPLHKFYTNSESITQILHKFQLASTRFTLHFAFRRRSQARCHYTNFTPILNKFSSSQVPDRARCDTNYGDLVKKLICREHI